MNIGVPNGSELTNGMLAKEHPEKCRKITAAADECEDLDRAIVDALENYGLPTWHPAGQGGD